METTELKAEMLPPIGEDPRGEWKWHPYKPTVDERRAAFIEKAVAGLDIFINGWSSKTPFLTITEVHEDGLTFVCHGWADKIPERNTWEEFWKWALYNGGSMNLN